MPLSSDPIAEARRQWIDHGWADAADGMAAVTAIVRTQQIFLSRIDRVLGPLGLTFARYELLTLLSFTRSGALPMAKASARLQVHPTSVTDGRMTLVAITDDGRSLALAATRELNAEVFTDPGFSDPELSELNRMLETFRREAGDFGG